MGWGAPGNPGPDSRWAFPPHPSPGLHLPGPCSLHVMRIQWDPKTRYYSHLTDEETEPGQPHVFLL